MRSLTWMPAIAVIAGCGARTALFDVEADDGSAGGATDATSPQPDSAPRDSDAQEIEACAPDQSLCEGECISGRCPVTIASKQGLPVGIAVDATSVYWGNGPLASVIKAPLGGGKQTTLWTSPGGLPNYAEAPFAVAVDATNVYWTTLPGGVMSVPLEGGEPTTLAIGDLDLCTYPNSVGDIAASATGVYWIRGANTPSGLVLHVPLGGGTLTTLASGRNVSRGIAVDAESVYWASPDAVMKQPLGGGAAETIAASGGAVVNLIVDATSIYWISAGGLIKASLAGDEVTTLASGVLSPLAPFSPLGVDTTNVYWIDSAVKSVPLDGGAPTTLFAGFNSGVRDFMAVSAASLYWTQNTTTNVGGSGTVSRLTPK